MDVKTIAKGVIDQLPDNSTFDEIIYTLYVKAKFDKGEQEIRRRNGINHTEAKQRLQNRIK